MSKQVLEVAGAVDYTSAIHAGGVPKGDKFNEMPTGTLEHQVTMAVKSYKPGTPGYEGDGWDDKNGV